MCVCVHYTHMYFNTIVNIRSCSFYLIAIANTAKEFSLINPYILNNLDVYLEGIFHYTFLIFFPWNNDREVTLIIKYTPPLKANQWNMFPY